MCPASWFPGGRSPGFGQRCSPNSGQGPQQVLTVDISPVADMNDGHLPSLVVYLVDHAIIADSNAPRIAIRKLQAA